MKPSKFDIRQLTAQAHGHTGNPFSNYDPGKSPGADFGKGIAGGYRQNASFNSVTQSLTGKTNLLGVPFFMEFWMWIRTDLHSKIPPIPMPLPNEPLVSLSGENRIVKTPIAGSGRRGTVKELISADDWRITISGVCVNTIDTKLYPYPQVNVLRMLKKQRGSIRVYNDLLYLFGIRKIAVESLTLDAMPGVQHAQKYEITALSDADFLESQKGESHLKRFARRYL